MYTFAIHTVNHHGILRPDSHQLFLCAACFPEDVWISHSRWVISGLGLVADCSEYVVQLVLLYLISEI